jgi:hypothetical protein
MDLSSIRILGLGLGVIGLLFTFLYYRGIKWKRNNFILLFLFNAALITVSISPDILNVLRDMLAMKSSERGRILSLLILSVIFLVLALVYLKSKLDYQVYQFDNLVRALGKEGALLKVDKEQVKRVMIVIPAYNERENLEMLLPKLPGNIGGMEVGALIVDDGSSDDTPRLTCPPSCIMVRSVIRHGGGAALKLGYDILLHHEVELCITMDADNQHKPEDIPKLLDPIIDGEADIVVGSRVLGKSLDKNKVRNSGLRLFNFIISRLLKQKISDCSSGFRAFKTTVLKGIHLKETQYHTSELIIEAVKKGYRLTEVPITIHERKYGQTKKGSTLKYALNFIRVILKTWWR